MSKPIEFETQVFHGRHVDKLSVRVAHGPSDGIVIEGGLLESDPAKLEALADAIKRAADALRKSQQLTFADLKPGEFFRFADCEPGDVCQRDSGNRYAWIVPHMDTGCTTAGHAAVRRVKATFTPEEPTI